MLNHYSVRIEKADLADNWYMLDNTSPSYYNIIQKPSFPYYSPWNMWNGVMIDMNDETLGYNR
jgi:hypothetical protein